MITSQLKENLKPRLPPQVLKTLKFSALFCRLNSSDTFIGMVRLSNKVPIETVSKMPGHRSLKQTSIYAKILDVKD